jgi:DNA repair protein RadD
MIELWPFQRDVVAAIEAAIAAGIKRIIVVAPTGSGKTVIASEVTKRAMPKPIGFVAHRDELLVQARDKLGRFGITAGIIKAGRDKDQRPQALVQVCGIQTLHARAIRSDRIQLPPARILWVDECHHARAMTYESLIAAYPDSIIIGLTATPCRGDGRGLGNCFERMIECPQVAELIRLGYLVPPKIFAPPAPDLGGIKVTSGDYQIDQLSDRMNTDILVGDIVTHWLKHAQRRRTVCFAVDVAHSAHIVEEMVKSEIRAEHLDGNTEQNDREAILARLASGETEVVSNCMVLTEGFDCPDVGCIVLARPTRSLGLYRQMIGRGLRAAPDKTDVIILDHSGGVHRHGRPDDPIEWTLEQDRKATNKTHAARVAASGGKDPFCECQACGHLRMRGAACENCGWEPKPRPRPQEYLDIDLVELGQRAARRTEEDRHTFYLELRGYQLTARKRDGSLYAAGWAAQQFKQKHGFFPPWSWNNQAPIEPTLATQRWIKSRMIAYAKRRAAS